MKVLLYFESDALRATRKFDLPDGISPFEGMVLANDTVNFFRVKGVRVSLERPKNPPLLTLEYIPTRKDATLNREAMEEVLRESGWLVA